MIGYKTLKATPETAMQFAIAMIAGTRLDRAAVGRHVSISGDQLIYNSNPDGMQNEGDYVIRVDINPDYLLLPVEDANERIVAPAVQSIMREIKQRNQRGPGRPRKSI